MKRAEGIGAETQEEKRVMTAEDANRAGETSSDEENGHVCELIPPGERRLWSDIARRGAAQHEPEALLKKLRSILNKLTPTTLHKLAHDITRLDIRTVEELQAVTFMIHDRAVSANEKIFCGMYASLCDMIQGALPILQEQPANSSRRHVQGGSVSREITFKRMLVNSKLPQSSGVIMFA